MFCIVSWNCYCVKVMIVAILLFSQQPSVLSVKIKYKDQVGETTYDHPYIKDIEELDIPIEHDIKPEHCLVEPANSNVPKESIPVPDPLAPIDGNLIQSVRRAGLYAGMAYCEQAAVINQNCGRRCESELTYGTKILTYFNFSSTDSVGFVAVQQPDPTDPSTAKPRLIVSFRGTQTLRNWIENLKFEFTSIPWITSDHSDVLTHSGFFSSYQVTRDILHNSLSKRLGEYPNCDILITGHSLGGALATLAAMDLLLAFPEIQGRTELLSFGAPRVGNQAFAMLLESLLQAKAEFGLKHYRVTNADDPVVHLPPYRFRFRHTTRELYSFANNHMVLEACSVDDGEDYRCANSCWYPDNISDHLRVLDLIFGSPCEGYKPNPLVLNQSPILNSECEIIAK